MRTVFAFLVLIVFVSCGNKTTDIVADKTEIKADYLDEKGKLLSVIKAYEDTMHKSKELNKAIALKAIQAYTNYFNAFPKDSVCAEYLFKAAEIADNSGDYINAIKLYNSCYENFPKFPLHIEALYFQGLIYADKLKDYPKAKERFEKLIWAYPKSDLAEQSKATMLMMGKSDEELIKELEKKNGVK